MDQPTDLTNQPIDLTNKTTCLIGKRISDEQKEGDYDGGRRRAPLCGGGEMAETIAVNGTLSDATRAALMAYFKSKFKL